MICPEETKEIPASAVKVGDYIDLEGNPRTPNFHAAEFEYALVSSVELEHPHCIAITFEGYDTVGFHPSDIVRVKIALDSTKV